MEREKSTPCSGENLNEIQSSENKTVQNDDVSQFRIIASQLLVLFPIALMKIRFGLGMGFTTILIPEMYKKDSEIAASLDVLTWFSSHCFVTPIAAVSGGFIAQYIGARRLLMFTYLFYILADLMFHWADNVAMILVAQVIVGFTNGISKGPIYAYIAEIMHPKFRSITMAVMNFSVLAGEFLSKLLGNFLYWRTQNLIILIFPAIAFAFIPFMPDSPHWLASKNRFEDAEKSLARLRGWTTRETVRAELYSSISNASNSLSSTESARDTDINPIKQTNLKKALSLYLDRSFYIPLLTVTCIFFFGTCNGAYSLSTFAVLIFEEIKSPIDGHVGNLIFSVSTLVGALVYISTVNFLGKRILTLTSVFIISVCFIVAVVFLYLINDNQQEFKVYSWVVTIVLIICAFAQQTGIGKIMYFLNSELFPQKLRYVGGGIGYFINEILVAILGKTFLYIVLAIGFPNTLIVFLFVNIVGFIIIYFILPETEGVSLQEIEAHYAGTRNLKKKRVDNK